ncbi:MAG: fibronectin type III domain-containing protein [Patescibacteria group bacterium]
MRKFEKFLKKTLSIILLVILVSSALFANPQTVEAATFNWTQSNWSGGASANTASHPTNQTGWSYYASKDANLSAGASSLTLSTIASSTTQTTNADFNSGATSTTQVSNNSVVLAVETPGASCESSITVNHTAGAISPITTSITYGTVITNLTGSNKCWITQNLGASQQASSATDNTDASAGWYWQFNRKQGYAVGPTPAWTITSIDESSDWTSANDPCTIELGTGWRLPTYTEWANADGGWANYNDTYASVLKLHAAGGLFASSGGLYGRGATGLYWSSTQYISTLGYYLIFDSSSSNMGSDNNKASGFSVRCLTDNILGYYSSGTFTSNVINLGTNVNWGNLSWTETGTGTITMKARSCDDSACSGEAAFTSCSNITNGAALSTGNCVTNGHQYIQYQTALSTSDISFTPSLDDVTIGYNYYPSSQNLTSSKYDSSSDGNVIGGLAWDEDATLTSGTSVTLSLRTASSTVNLDSASWSDFTNATANCSKAGTRVTCTSSAIPSSMKDGSGDQWQQYKVTLTSTGANKPTVTSVILTYVVNARPEFDVPNTTASQISDSGSANWGKVQITYPIKDIDTTSGSITPGYVTPSFEYNTGSGWTTITSGYLNSGALDNKAVQEGSYTSHTAYWDAKTQIPSTYTTTGQIRITINDNEGANNSTSTTISNITIDTTNPTLSAFTLDSSADTLTISASDNSNLQYLISNNQDGSADGSNAISSSWQTVGGTSTSTTRAWAYSPDSTGYESVTIAYRDIYGNTATTTDIAPYQPKNFYYKDICNTAINDWREFLSWGVYTATTTSSWANYKVYRSTDGTTYSLLGTLSSDVNTNYYIDSSVASTTTYYYKVLITDSDGDISSFTDPVSDLPNGQGGSDSTAPLITSGPTVTETKSTWASIVWTTDEISNSVVEYGLTTSYGLTSTVNTMVTSHSVTLTGLTPNTTYYFRVKSTDIASNTVTSSGSSFVTTQGPIISSVTAESVTDNTASIVWNTTTDSSSWVYYSTSASFTSSSTEGTNTLVGTSTAGYYQHRVTLTGLTKNTTYYYYVKSTDANSDTATDTNGGNYYTFTTTYDNQPPVISDITVPVRAYNALVVTWNTDENANTRLYYDTVSHVDCSGYSNSSTLDTNLTISHAAAITSLIGETAYYYRVISADANGNTTCSSEQETSTVAENEIITVYVGGGGPSTPVVVDTTAPAISNINVSDISAFGATVNFSISEPAAGFVHYGKDTNYGFIAGSDTLASSHSVKLAGLRLGTEYHYKVTAMDKAGNVGQSSDQTFSTLFAAEALEELTTLENAEQFQEQLEGIIESVMPSLVPPFVSNVIVDNITETSATVKWKTNIPAFGSVSYASDSEYNQDKEKPYVVEIVESTKEKIKEHTLELRDLSPATKYHLQAKSYVFPDVIGKSKDSEFYTLSSKIKPEITRVGNTDAEVRWVTAKETSSFAEYRNLATNKLGRMGDDRRVQSHFLKIENLAPGTNYEIKVFGYDQDNNIIEADSITIRTKQDISPPVISSIRIDNAMVPGKRDKLQTVISWKTDESSNSRVYFEEGIGISDKLTNKTGQENEYTTDHIVIITSMKPATVYRIKVSSRDEAGNTADSPMRTFLTPRSAESVLDVIVRNFEESFGFLKRLR